MPTIPTLLAFSAAAVVLLLIPGPNVLYIITRGIDQGRSAAVASALGVDSAMFVHIGAALLGLTALIASSDLLFNIVKFSGAAYLLWMGIANLRAAPCDPMVPRVPRHASYRNLFTKGMVVNLLNPKVALFFIAFLPQFIDPDRGSAATQILALGGVFVAMALVTDLAYAWASGSVGGMLGTCTRMSRHRDRVTGTIYILLGAMAALTGSGAV